MKRGWIIALAVILAAGLAIFLAYSARPNLRDLYADSVFVVRTTLPPQTAGAPTLQGPTGTAFFIAPHYLITTAHNLEMPPDAAPHLNKQELERRAHITVTRATRSTEGLRVSLFYKNDELDLAILLLPQDLAARPVCFGDSQTAQVSTALFALGYPLNEGLSLLPGFISALHSTRGMWQTNIQISPGMSGSPVFDSNSALVGIAWGGRAGSHSTYVIPATRARAVLHSAAVSPQECPAVLWRHAPLLGLTQEAQETVLLLAAGILAIALIFLFHWVRLPRANGGTVDIAYLFEREAGLKQYYSRHVGWILRFASRVFNPRAPAPAGEVQGLGYYLSPETLYYTLRGSLNYPMIFVFGVWALYGITVAGIPNIVFAGDPYARIFAVTCITLAAVFVILFSWGSDRGSGFVYYVFAFVFATTAFLFILGSSKTPSEGESVAALTGIFAAALALSLIDTKVSWKLLAAGLAGFAVITIVLLLRKITVDAAIVFYCGVVVAILIIFTERWSARRGHLGTYYIFHFLGFGALGLYLSGNAFFSALEVTRLPLLFFCFVPGVGAIFDWLSIGITRWLLDNADRKSASENILYGLAGAFFTFVLLFLLSISVVTVLQVANSLSAHGARHGELVDVFGLIGTLRNNPSDPSVWWVYVMLLTTLFPTLVHTLILGYSVFAWTTPNFIRRLILRSAEVYTAERAKRVLLTSWLTLRSVFSWVFALGLWLGLYKALSFALPTLGLVFLNCAQFAVTTTKALMGSILLVM